MARLESLAEEGIVKYFFHSPSSRLPIRDVLNEQGAGHKREPHIEAGAENYLTGCYQRNVRNFAFSDRRYLFWVTMCRNRGLEQNGRQFVVGYLDKKEVLERGDHLAVRGDVHLYSFSDAILVSDIFDWKSFTRPLLNSVPFIDKRRTKKILACFKGKRNITDRCIEEIIRLDTGMYTCVGLSCDYANRCPRIS
ncbi:hypothetical protein COV93_02715 [Candidatus Woesearchaeota archaeon CG11_big_fil_rev_8_21_14_0_20_43_8]|nr:MAG: hypothetical protein COV93_02715 [Candidatus Woesearchaeota archaeon CG11_big_fil_rev_8_21_14_0_20_43_8]PIO05319.1 MAG: hypothetical protein COT47_05345 [Candidatus Woesearchaeota archaeon CG08_land_8_20_14_0_20_43_7]